MDADNSSQNQRSLPKDADALRVPIKIIQDRFFQSRGFSIESYYLQVICIRFSSCGGRKEECFCGRACWDEGSAKEDKLRIVER